MRQSYQEKSWNPIFTRVGGILLNHDTKLYVESVKLEDTTNKWATFKHFMLALDSFWFIYFYIFLSYKLINWMMGTMNSIGGFILAIIFVSIFEIVSHFFIVDSSILVTDNASVIIESWKIIPFRGLIKFGSVLISVFIPLGDKLLNTTNVTGV